MNHPFSRQPGQPVANPVHVPIIQKDPQGQQDQQSRLGIISAAQGIVELVDPFGQIPSAVVPHGVIQDRPEQEKQGDEEKGAPSLAPPPDSKSCARPQKRRGQRERRAEKPRKRPYKRESIPDEKLSTAATFPEAGPIFLSAAGENFAFHAPPGLRRG